MHPSLHILRRIVTATCVFTAMTASVRAQEIVGIAPTGDPNEVMELTFSETPLDAVLQQLEILTGRTVIRPQALPSTNYTFNNIEPASRPKFTKAEVVIAIESLLAMNGVGVAPLGDKFIKVVPIQQVRQEAPELVVGSLRDAPPSGKVVSKVFRFQYLDPAQFQGQIAPFLSGYATVVPFQNSNTVIVTDSVSNLQRLEALVSEIDRRQNIETKFYQIRYANAGELAQSIRTTIESARSGSGGAGGRVVVQQGGPPGTPAAPGAGPQQVVLNPNTAINADERTNQLIVVTDPANLPFFDDLIAKLDVPADAPTAIEVIPMQYADAEELASLLSQFVSGRSQSRRSSNGSRDATRNTGPRPTFPTQPPEPAPGPERVQAVAAALDGALEPGGTQFSDLMTIIADTRSNAIVVSGTNNDIHLIKRVIDELDILLAQVRIEVVIAEVTLNKGYARGIDAFSVSYSEIQRDAIGNPGDDNYVPALTENGIQGAGTFGPIAGTIAGVFRNGRFEDISIDALVRAGRANSDVNVLSVPTITTLHNKEATFIAGESRPLITGSVTTGGLNTGTTSTVQYQDIAIELVVTPKVGPNDVIEMEIDQKVDDIGENVEIDGNDQPAIIRRQATSTVSVKNGQLIVLGGLQRNRLNKSHNRMFILGDIPGLDALFSRRVEDNQRVELLVFIKPTVLRSMAAADTDARESIHELHLNEINASRVGKIIGEDVVPPSDEKKDSSSGPNKPRRPASPN